MNLIILILIIVNIIINSNKKYAFEATKIKGGNEELINAINTRNEQLIKDLLLANPELIDTIITREGEQFNVLTYAIKHYCNIDIIKYLISLNRKMLNESLPMRNAFITALYADDDPALYADDGPAIFSDDGPPPLYDYIGLTNLLLESNPNFVAISDISDPNNPLITAIALQDINIIDKLLDLNPNLLFSSNASDNIFTKALSFNNIENNNVIKVLLSRSPELVLLKQNDNYVYDIRLSEIASSLATRLNIINIRKLINNAFEEIRKKEINWQSRKALPILRGAIDNYYAQSENTAQSGTTTQRGNTAQSGTTTQRGKSAKQVLFNRRFNRHIANYLGDK
jgi:hypothetical protein